MKTIIQFNSIESFATQRLVARKLKASDLDQFMVMHTNPEVMKTLGGIRTKEEIRDNLAWNLKQWQDNGVGLWMFYLIPTQEWIGRGGLRKVEVDGEIETEINYVLMPQYMHQGFATEIAKACIEIAFEKIHLDNVVAFTLTTNTASKRVMEKSGFQYEKNIIHANQPHVLYRIKKDQ